MSAAELAREAGAIDAAAGIALLLGPWAAGRAGTFRRGFGLGLVLVAWVVLAISLVSRDDLEGAADRLSQPVWAVAAAAGVIGGAALFVLCVRVVLWRPWTWFALLGLALPVRVPVPVGGETRNLLLPLYAVLLIGLAAWIWGRARGRLEGAFESSTLLDLPIAAFVGFSLISVLWSGDTREAAVKAVFFYIPFVLLYRLVLAWWRRADAARVLVATTIAMAVPVAVLALGQYAARWTFWNDRLEQSNIYSRFFRVNGIFFDPNILGRYLVLAIAAAVAVAWLARTRGLVALMGIACAVLAAGVMVTFSRSSALALILALVIMAIRAFGWRRVTLIGGGLAVVLSAGVIATSQNVKHAVTDSDRLERVSEGRFDLVKGGLELWAKEPVTGTGLGAFAVRYEESLTQEERNRTRVIISHNAPITILTEVGIVGFALFVALCVAGVVVLRRSAGAGAASRELARSGTPDARGWAAWTALAMLAGIFIHSLLYAALVEDPYTWVIAAAGVAVGGTALARQPAVEARPAPTEILPSAS